MFQILAVVKPNRRPKITLHNKEIKIFNYFQIFLKAALKAGRLKNVTFL